MECRRCGHPTTLVKERRGIRRRRECPICGPKHRFSTFEIYCRPNKGKQLGYKMDPAVVLRGEDHPQSFLTALYVVEIRRLHHVEKLTPTQIAIHLRMPHSFRSTVNNILKGRSWAHVPEQVYDPIDYTSDECNHPESDELK